MSTEQLLRLGVRVVDTSGGEIILRYLADDDDLHVLTEMLHDAYAPLAAAGMRFVASHQDVDTTRRRIERGETIVASANGAIVGTVTLVGPGTPDCDCPFYERADVAHFGQFAVHPARQRFGIGSRLLDLVERRAREKGAAFLALDTSEQAHHLIRYYEARGYRFIEYRRWQTVNYRSVVMARSLADKPT